MNGSRWPRGGPAARELTARLRLLLLVFAATTGSPVEAHGLSDVEGEIDLQPVWARPGDTATLVVRLHELVPGAARAASLRVRAFRGGAVQEIPLLAQAHLTYEGKITLARGSYDLRIHLEQERRRLVALTGFAVGENIELGELRDRELFFVPAGMRDAIPLLDHLFGVIVGLAALGTLVALVRRKAWRSVRREAPFGIPSRLLAFAAAGAVSMPVGGYWDISFHLASGRESFFSPPHLLIYGGILLALLVTVAGIITGRRRGTSWREQARRQPMALLAAGGLALQLASAPFDELWHIVFGLDVSIWSPPHGLLIMGGFIACVALASVTVRHESAGTKAIRVFTLAGALLIGTVFLAELELPFPKWHVSQDRPRLVYAFFLGAFGAIVGIVARRSIRSRWAASATAGAFLGLRVLVHVMLTALGQASRPAWSAWLLLPLAIGMAFDLLATTRDRDPAGQSTGMPHDR